MTTIPPIILSGSIAIDRIMRFKGSYKNMIHPEKIHSLSLSVLVDSLEDSPGGTAANIAYTLALLGDHPVIIGSMGKESKSYFEKLTQIGIDTSHVYQSKLPTATFTVITDADNNQVGGFYPGAMSDSQHLTLKTWEHVNPIVVVSAGDPYIMRKHVAECRQFGFELVYDVGQQVSNIEVNDLLNGIEAATVLILNDFEFGVISKKTGLTETQIKQKVPVVITTFGSKGSVVEGKSINKKIQVNAVKNVAVVDPTGAGDAYRAGFLYGYARKFDIESCCRLGSIAASFVLQYHGCQHHCFNSSEISSIYQQTYGDLCPITTIK